MIFWDGANHDSSQTAAWINAVDNTLLEGLRFDLLNTTDGNLLMLDSVISGSQKADVYFSIKLKAFRLKVLHGILKGTVTSGHPTKTTLGNSLRVVLMN